MKRKMCMLFSTFIVVIVSGLILYFSSIPEDIIIETEYKLDVERCELLKQVAIDSIIEGEGIDVDKIPSENIEYEINIANDEVIFNYHIKDYETQYNASINLSSDYEIINERYSKSEVYFVEYKKQYLINKIVIAGTISCLFGLVYLIIVLFLLENQIIPTNKK